MTDTCEITEMRHPDPSGARGPVPWLPSPCEELPVVRCCLPHEDQWYLTDVLFEYEMLSMSSRLKCW